VRCNLGGQPADVMCGVPALAETKHGTHAPSNLVREERNGTRNRTRGTRWGDVAAADSEVRDRGKVENVEEGAALENVEGKASSGKRAIEPRRA
jgi:hypothetical protein